VITESKDAELRPRISIKDEKGRTLNLPGSASQARYLLPVGATFFISEGDEVEAGDIIVKNPPGDDEDERHHRRPSRVAELFEARKPKEFA